MPAIVRSNGGGGTLNHSSLARSDGLSIKLIDNDMATQSEERKILGLEEAAKNVIIRSLGELADRFSSKFCCGGNVMVQDIRINYKRARDGSEIEISELVLPGADENAMSQFLAASSVASFGKGTEEVIDPSYRDAYKFDPDTMTTSFDLSNTSILTDIEALMVPNRKIQAELHKLNIYTGPNGHFKSHVDTPHSGEMFGSLVVCFPTQFTGGVLAARHQGQEVTFDWSTSYSSSPNPCTMAPLVRWAAFFSDVEHEILPVTSGYRITLTYNLYITKEMASDIFTWTPFYQYLQETLKNPQFMQDGGCLGFDCTHAYAFNSLNEKQLLPSVLKGADYMVFSVAKSLGLNVSVKPIIEGYKHWYLLPEFSKVFGKSHAFGWEPEDYHPQCLSLFIVNKRLSVYTRASLGVGPCLHGKMFSSKFQVQLKQLQICLSEITRWNRFMISYNQNI